MHVKCSRVIPKRIEIRYLTSKLEERGGNGMKTLTQCKKRQKRKNSRNKILKSGGGK